MINIINFYGKFVFHSVAFVCAYVMLCVHIHRRTLDVCGCVCVCTSHVLTSFDGTCQLFSNIGR